MAADALMAVFRGCGALGQSEIPPFVGHELTEGGQTFQDG